MRLSLLTFILLGIMLLTGCPNSPDKPAALTAFLTRERQNLEALEGQYNSAYEAGDLETARRRRNTITRNLMNLIDHNYNDFESHLARRRANDNILFDGIELGAAAATGITNGERAKNIISIGLTAFKGGRKSIDQNVFRERTTEAIISKMREARANLNNSIEEKLQASVETYPLEKAYGDVIEYFFAGTLQNGLQNLVQDAGQAAASAVEAATRNEELRIASEVELDLSTRIRQKITQLARELRSNDKQKADAARAMIQAALTSLNNTTVGFARTMLEDNAPNEDLIKALVQRSREANQGANREQKERALMTALGIQ